VTELVALLLVAFLTTGAVFHFYWGFGGQYGRQVAVPRREDGTPLFVPTAAATLAVAVVLALILVTLAVYELRLNLFVPRGSFSRRHS
jgi:multisubunit Na+/H+ antiporter MnhC subunit